MRRLLLVKKRQKLLFCQVVQELQRCGRIYLEAVKKAYNLAEISFGKDYFIPKPLDGRLFAKVSAAVAKAAVESGVARKPISDFAEYEKQLFERKK